MVDGPSCQAHRLRLVSACPCPERQGFEIGVDIFSVEGIHGWSIFLKCQNELPGPLFEAVAGFLVSGGEFFGGCEAGGDPSCDIGFTPNLFAG